MSVGKTVSVPGGAKSYCFKNVVFAFFSPWENLKNMQERKTACPYTWALREFCCCLAGTWELHCRYQAALPGYRDSLGFAETLAGARRAAVWHSRRVHGQLVHGSSITRGSLCNVEGGASPQRWAGTLKESMGQEQTM